MYRSILIIIIILWAISIISCKKKDITIDANITHLTDYNSNDGLVKLTATGGKAPYNYAWSNGQTGAELTNLAAGHYFVTVTDKRKRVVIDTIIITQPEWPVCIDYEGNNYKTAVVANKIWMIENLRSELYPSGDTISAFSINNADSNDVAYGKLYTWAAAMQNSTNESAQGVCPDGWHVPTDTEWTEYLTNISNYDNTIPDIKKSLNLSYAGFYNDNFHNLEVSVSFWSSTKAGDNAWKQYFNKNLSKAFRYHEKQTNAISVRCVKNTPLQ